MPVTVHLPDLLDAWNEAWEVSAEEVTVLFHEAAHPTLRGWRAQLAAVDRAAAAACEISERTNETDDYPPMARGPVLTEEGVALTATGETAEGATLILDALAGALVAEGWSGRLSVHTHVDSERPGRRPGGGFPTATLILALSGVDPRSPRDSPWQGAEDRRRRLTDLALDLLTDREGGVSLYRAHVTTPTTLSGARRLLDSALERDGFLVLLRSDHAHLAQFSLHWPGHLLLQLRSADVLTIPDVEQLREIARDWALDCDFAALTATYSSVSAIEGAISDSPAPIRLPSYYNSRRDLDQELVPDAFPWQILTGRHLQNAADLSAWSVTQVAPDRYEVCAPELATAHLDARAARRLAAPTEQETRQARLDFGPMLNVEPVEPRMARAQGHETATLVLALSGVDPARYPESAWVGTDGGRGRLADLALELVTGREGDFYLRRATITTRTTMTGFRPLLDSALQRHTFVFLQRSDRSHLARLLLRRPGHLILQLRSAEQMLPSDIEQLRAIGRDWAPDCDFVGLTGTWSSTNDLHHTIATSPALIRLPDYYRTERHLDQEQLPEAFPWQILTGRHLQNAADLSAWSLTQVAPDRYEVCAPELASPHLDARAARRLATPTEHETQQARLDFGPIINRGVR